MEDARAPPSPAAPRRSGPRGQGLGQKNPPNLRPEIAFQQARSCVVELGALLGRLGPGEEGL